MKVIDFHTHIFPDKMADKTIAHLAQVCHEIPNIDGKINGLLASMEEADITCSVIHPVVTAPSQFESIHRFAMQFLEGKLISFGGIHPENEDYKEKLRWIKNQGFKGIKLHPDYQGTYFNDIKYKRIVSYATEMDLIILVHAGLDPLCPNDIHCTPKMAAEVIDEVSPNKLVLAHMGGNALYDDVERYLVGKNVIFDTAYVLNKIKKEQFIRMINNHGIDKILFATDSPWGGQKDFINQFNSLRLDDTTKNAILKDNAISLLNL